jgi:hypothetical protein
MDQLAAKAWCADWSVSLQPDYAVQEDLDSQTQMPGGQC